MTTYSLTAKPAYAVVAWVDDNHVYVELPCTDGPPYITKYANTEAGLSKALGLMRDIHRKMKPVGGTFNLTQHPKLIRRDGKASGASHAKARAILKQMKII